MKCVPLERRVMLAVTYVDGVVRIGGSEGADSIDVRILAFESGPFAYALVNGERTDFTTPDQDTSELPRKVIIDAAGGDDAIELDNFLGYAVVRIDGRSGDDRITLRNKHAVIRGGAGDDVILLDANGFSDRHVAWGGKGNDLIRSITVGEDAFKGGEGDDTILGGGGHDTIVGGPGDDLLKGGSGDDVLKGGAGSDEVLGGSGDDVLYVKKKERHDAGKGDDDVLR